MRYFEIYDFKTLGRITLKQYFLMLKSYNLKRIDKERDMHWQSWLNLVVQNTKKQGKKTIPLFRSFDNFFDYEKALEQIKGKTESSDDNELRKLLIAANSVKK